MSKQQLFQEDLIFQENFRSMDEALAIMAKRLVQADLVKNSYEESIKEREKEFPTGLDLSVIGTDLPNIAIPHTNREHCKATKVILVKLNQGGISVGNMINPLQELQNVRYLFMIINGADSEQTGILSKIMEFVTNADNIKALEKAENIRSLYKVVKSYTL
ncbi:PTS system galactitol-specific IIA component [Sporomusaceae bacterium BoRhaA]|uniref:PTS sugar transporter subunit IIA n=1 Tax=Pelorhabdus rhamnosifermentans TaxID=2772457 RepID=UPI001C060EA5|nr:PTS sugar transporter subunit IIA [Pelorhabdus rhamnosifermentans]MBU2699693.1 PTS system galactitol-specific IIA component [Pelorhabdus rhamnosifermentans]